MTQTLVRRVVVEGFVQGVGYREFARRAALRRGVSGWVRNRSDGTVEALVSAAPAVVGEMLAEMRRGPGGGGGDGSQAPRSGRRRRAADRDLRRPSDAVAQFCPRPSPRPDAPRRSSCAIRFCDARWSAGQS